MFLFLKRIIKWGVIGLKRNWVSSTATVVVMTISLFLLGSLFFIKYFSKETISSLENQLALTVFFKNNTPEEEIILAKKELENIPSVEKIKYVSKEEALEIFSKKYKEEQVIQKSLAALGSNPFLAHLNIKTSSPQKYRELAKFIEEKSLFKEKVDHINFSQIEEIATRLSNISSSSEKFLIIVFIIFALASFLVSYNTIKLAIFSMKDEISIMRLVGASNKFISGPFWVQAIFIGLLSGVLASLALGTVAFVLKDKGDFFSQTINFFYFWNKNLLLILTTLSISGIVLNLIATSLALKNYLKT